MSLLRLENVTMAFGGLLALDDVSFEVEEGSVLGVIGPNGAGKTTLFNVVAGVFKPTGGRVLFGGKDITGHRPHQVCHLGIARTFQLTQPFEGLDVYSNVLVGGLCRSRNWADALSITEDTLEFCGLADKRFIRSENLTVVDRKRLETARALATQPSVLLLDEIAAGCNPSEVGEIIDLINRIKKRNVTVVMIEHVLRAVMTVSDSIIVLNFGKKIAEGQPNEVVGNPDVITAYLGDRYVNLDSH